MFSSSFFASIIFPFSVVLSSNPVLLPDVIDEMTQYLSLEDSENLAVAFNSSPERAVLSYLGHGKYTGFDPLNIDKHHNYGMMRERKYREFVVKQKVNQNVFLKACEKGRLFYVQHAMQSDGYEIGLAIRRNGCIDLASKYGHTEIVRLLLADNRIDPSNDNNLPIRLASKYGHCDVVQLLLADNRTNPADYNNDAMCSAITEGKKDIVQLLLADDRINPEGNNDHGDAIITALYSGYAEILEMLLGDRRIDPSSFTARSYQFTQMTMFQRFLPFEPNVEVFKVLLRDKRVNMNVFYRALQNTCHRGLLDIVEVLLADHRFDPSVEDNYCIREASYKGHLEIVKLLLTDNRTDPSAKKNEAIQTASREGHTEIVKVLLSDSRTDPGASYNYSYALYSNDEDLFLDKDKWSGVVKNSLNYFPDDFRAFGYNPIIGACRNGHIEIVKILLADNRADPGEFEDYAIREASYNGHLEIVKLLLEDKRVNASARNCEAIKCSIHEFGDIRAHYDVIRELVKDSSVCQDFWRKSVVEYSWRFKHKLVQVILDNDAVDPNSGVDYLAQCWGKDHRNSYSCNVTEVEALESLMAKNYRNFNRPLSAALIYACKNNLTEFAKILLADNRVDPNANNNSAIEEASKMGLYEIVKLLLEDERVVLSNNSIKYAIDNGQSEVLRSFISDNRFDPVFAFNYAKDTWNNDNVIKLLLKHKIVISSISDGYAIEWAVRKGEHEILKALLDERLVDPTLSDIWEAIREKDVTATRLLLNDGRIDPNDVIKSSYIFRGTPEILKLFLGDNRLGPDCFKYFIANSCPRDAETVKLILEDGRFEAPSEKNYCIPYREIRDLLRSHNMKNELLRSHNMKKEQLPSDSGSILDSLSHGFLVFSIFIYLVS